MKQKYGDHTIRINVTGPTGVGKSAVAEIIHNALLDAGFNNVEFGVDVEDEISCSSPEDREKRKCWVALKSNIIIDETNTRVSP
jgi:hypothetical protein